MICVALECTLVCEGEGRQACPRAGHAPRKLVPRRTFAALRLRRSLLLARLHTKLPPPRLTQYGQLKPTGHVANLQSSPLFSDLFWLCD